MPSTSVGSTKLQVPIAKGVGVLHAPTSVDPSTPAPPVPVPPPSSLFINGRLTKPIDVRTMSVTDILAAINNAGIVGVTASTDAQGRLVISGIQSISGDQNLRAILGI